MHEFVHRRMILKVDFGMDRTDEDDEDEGGPRHYAPENDMHTGYYTSWRRKQSRAH